MSSPTIVAQIKEEIARLQRVLLILEPGKTGAQQQPVKVSGWTRTFEVSVPTAPKKKRGRPKKQLACEICQAPFKNLRGLALHQSLKHGIRGSANHKAKPATGHTISEYGRKKLSESAKRRWAAAKAGGEASRLPPGPVPRS